MLDLVGPEERVIDALDHIGHRTCGIETLVGIHLTCVICVGRNLPTTEIDSLHAGAHLLNGHISRERSKCRYRLFFVKKLPEFLSAARCKGVFNLHRPPQTLDGFFGVVSLNSFESVFHGLSLRECPRVSSVLKHFVSWK